MITRRNLMLASTNAFSAISASWLQLSASVHLSRRKRCVLIWLDGGPSHLDTIDPKPNAPDGNGGPLRPIATNVAGIQISESLPQIAKIIDKCVLIRGMSTKQTTHDAGRLHLHTGYLSAVSLDFPSIGAVVSYLHSDERSLLPRYVHVGGGRSHGCSSGFLGAQHNPLTVVKEIPHLQTPIKQTEFSRRVELLRWLEAKTQGADDPLRLAHRQTLDMTLDFMASDFPTAFDLSSEPDSVREQYGKTIVGDACLQARRLLEKDVAFVEVNSPHWDMHGGIYSSGTSGIQHKAREIDKAVSALSLDLESRGLLDDTLIVWMGEFGRTPKLNNSPGRDHYAAAWSTMLIGGGIPGGQVVGKTDQTGGTVIDRPVSAADFLATIYRLLGFSHTREIIGPGNRPLPLIDRNEKPVPIESLF